MRPGEATAAAALAGELHLTISRVSSRFDSTAGQQETLSWSALAERLKAHDRRRAKDGPCWLPVTLAPSCYCGEERCGGARGHRIDRNVREVFALVLDVDKLSGDDQVEATVERLRELGLEAVVHTSFSDREKGLRALRVVVPLDRPVAGERWAEFWQTATEMLAIPCEPACCNPARLWYLPACPPDAAPATWTIEGAPLDTAAVWPFGEAKALERAEQRARNLPRPAPVAGPMSVEERARRYVERMPPAISGQGGHDATYEVACVLVRGFALDEATAFDVLRGYNARCEPPWRERELEHKVRSAASKSTRQLGYLLDADPPPPTRTRGAEPPPPSDADTPPEIDSDYSPNVPQNEGEEGRAPQLLPLVDVSTIPEIVEQAWLVDGLIPSFDEGAAGYIFGPPKARKSLLLAELALSIATGTPAMGRFEVRRSGRVVGFFAEDPKSETSRRMHRLARGKRVAFPADRVKLLDVSSLAVDNPATQQSLAATLRAIPDLAFVWLDPMVRLHTVNDNRAEELGPIHSFLRTLSKSLPGVVLTLAHHTGHSGTARGSTDYGAFGDFNLYLEKPDATTTRVRTLEFRGCPPGESFSYQVEDLAGEDGPAMRLMVDGRDPEQVEKVKEADVATTMHALRDAHPGISGAEVRDRLRGMGLSIGNSEFWRLWKGEPRP